MTNNDNRKVVFCGVLTVSDRCASGVNEDTSGPNLQKLLQEFNGFKAVVKVRKIVADDKETIKNTLIDWCDKEGCNLILTTGGTGLSPRDVTPDATMEVIEREIMAVVIGIISASLASTRYSMLTRMKCGSRGKTFIINFPGNERVAEQCLTYVFPILSHAIDLLQNNLDEVNLFHKQSDTRISAPRDVDTPAESEVASIQSLPSSRPANTVAVAHGVVMHGLTHGVGHGHGINHGTGHGHGMDHGLGHGHGMDHGLGHGHGMGQGFGHGDGIHGTGVSGPSMVAISEAELAMDNTDLENELRLAGIDMNSEVSPTSELTTTKVVQKRSLEALAAEKRRLNPEFFVPMKIARRDRTSPYSLTPMDKATATVLEKAPVLPVITLPYKDTLGFVLAKDVVSPEAIPQFAASIKDGYAVIASDTPGELLVMGSSIYGVPGPDENLKKGQAIRITTGSPIPEGANAVVQVEDTLLKEEAKQGEIEIKITVTKEVTEGQDIRQIGSDIKQGELVLQAGTLLGPGEIGVLATVGILKVPVYKKPVVAVMSTGTEVLDPGTEPLQKGQIRDSNRITLLSALRQAGYETVDMGIVMDDIAKLQQSLESAMNKADVVITSGGVSMGEKDFLKTVIQALGGTIHFGRVLMKPGKPTTFATVNAASGRKLFFALPGNPVSSIVTFHLFTLPALKKMSGLADPSKTVIKVRLSSGIKLDARPEYQRCNVCWRAGDGTPWAITTGIQMSSRLSSMVNANALLVLPPRTETKFEILPGELVDAMLIGAV